MHTQLLSQSPLLALPLFALIVFLTVFVAVAVRVLLTAKPILDAAAQVPLMDEGEAHREI